MKIFVFLFPIILFFSCTNIHEENDTAWCGTSNQEIKENMIPEEYKEQWTLGEKLFRQNCAACHKINKDITGPKLKGLKSKWTEAGEEEMLYEFIKNPKKLYESGKSKMAIEAWESSPVEMPPYEYLTKEEIDAIFFYSDIECILPDSGN